MNTFDSLNFNVNVTDNASVVLNNIENTLRRIQSLQGGNAVSTQNVAGAYGNAYIQVNQYNHAQSQTINQAVLVEKTMNRTARATQTASLGFARLVSTMFRGIIVARYLGRFFSQSIKETAAYIENLNLFSVAYGETYQETLDWALELADGFGLASNEVVKFAATFRQLSTSIGLVEDTAESVSKTVTQLGYDISALFNISVEEAMEKLQSGLYSGYTRPMRALGIDVSQNQVDNLFKTNEALSKLNVSAMNLKQGDKVLARLIITMEAASNSFGTMHREINTLQSQIRILQGSWSNFNLALGDLIHEPAKEALISLNSLIIGITNVIRAFHPLQKVDQNPIISNLGEEAEETNESLDKLQGKLAKFDKFNVLGDKDEKTSELAVTEALTKELQKQQEIYEARVKQVEHITNLAVEEAKKITDWFIVTDDKGVFVKWTNQAKTLGVVLGSLVAFGMVAFFAKMIVNIATLTTKMKALSFSTSLLGKAFTLIQKHPIILVVTAIASLLILMYNRNENFRKSVNRLITALMSLIGSALSPIIKILEVIMDVLGGVLNVVAEVLSWVINSISIIIEIVDKLGILEALVWGVVIALSAWAAVKLYYWFNTQALPMLSLLISLLPKIIANIKSLIVLMAKGLVNALHYVLTALTTTTGALVTTFAGIGFLIVGISKFISAFDQLSNGAKVWIPVLAGLAGVITAIAAGLTFMKGNWVGAIGLGALVAGIGLSVGTSLATVSKHADGGYSNANLIMTHENGKREWVGKAAGSSAIVNDTQMSDIMEGAVSKGVFNALRANSAMGSTSPSNETIVVKVGEEAVFTAVRKRAKKQGLDFASV